jgi:hypothetical protein
MHGSCLLTRWVLVPALVKWCGGQPWFLPCWTFAPVMLVLHCEGGSPNASFLVAGSVLLMNSRGFQHFWTP